MVTIEGVDPKMIANNLDPFEATHPGELIKDEIEYRGLSQKQLSMDMGVSYAILNEIVNCKRPVDAEFALLCEKALGIPAYMLMRLQADYDMVTTKRDKSFMRRLASVRKVAAVL